INVVNEGLVRGAQALMRDLLTVFGAVAAMFYYDWVLAFLVLGLFAVGGGPVGAVARRARTQTLIAQRQLGALTALLSESLGGARFVRTYRLESHEEQRANDAFEERRSIAAKLVRNRARTDPILEVLGGLALAGVILVAGVRIIERDMT